jgi:uncharacterized protein
MDVERRAAPAEDSRRKSVPAEDTRPESVLPEDSRPKSVPPEDSRPGPVADEDSQPYWTALRDHRILLQTCTRCGEVRCPPLPACANCGGIGLTNSYATGAGTLYSWIEVHRAVGTLRPDEVPCTIATVELAEGPRLLGRLRQSRPAIGGAVAATFVDHRDWTEISFVPAGERADEVAA